MTDQQFAPAQKCGLRREAVEKLAESYARALGYNAGDDLKELISRLGGTVSYKDFWDEDTDSGSILIRKPGAFEVFLGKDTSATRDRFTMAHELGHYVLHYLLPLHNSGKDPGPVMASRYGSDRTEWEANWFAAAFLMPEEAFRESYEEHRGNIPRVARHFGVSMMAAQIRAEALGLESADCQ